MPEFQIFLQIVFATIQSEFPKILSYKRFVEMMPRILYFLTLLFCCTLRKQSKIAYIDSTSLNVCYQKKFYRNKIFKELAKFAIACLRIENHHGH